MTVTIVARIDCEMRNANYVQEALLVAVMEVQEEQGCEAYELHRVISGSGRFLMVERWETQTDVDRHIMGKPYRELLVKLRGVADVSVTRSEAIRMGFAGH